MVVQFKRERLRPINWQQLMRIIYRVGRELKGTNEAKSLVAYFRAANLLTQLAKGNHNKVTEIAEQLVSTGQAIGHYYLSINHILHARYIEARREVEKFLNCYPYHPDGTYLLVNILTEMNKKETAWDILEKLVLQSKRLKTWMVMGNLVENEEDYIRFRHNIEQRQKAGKLSETHFDIIKYTSNAALRAGLSDEVKRIWREAYRIYGPGHHSIEYSPNSKPYFSDEMAVDALRDLKKVLNAAQIEFFLISGTLLGCIREGKILGHDKDIDVGVWSEVGFERVKECLAKSGFFYIVQTRQPYRLLMIKHVNDIAIDVFFHFKEADNYWHGGVKTTWSNKPFTLIEHQFLGNSFMIPKDAEQYLTENYGDWRTPKKVFESCVDAPNVEIADESEMIAYGYRKLILSKTESQKQMYTKLLNDCNENI